MGSLLTANLPQKRYKAEQVRVYESRVAAGLNIEMFELMQNAGAAVFELLNRHYPDKTVHDSAVWLW